MGRLARFTEMLPFRQFGRLNHLRHVAPCDVRSRPVSLPLFDTLLDMAPREPAMPPMPSAQPAFARVSLNSALGHEPARRAPVRVYHGPSRLIMVGTIDAVCRMIDRAIDEQQAELHAAPAR